MVLLAVAGCAGKGSREVSEGTPVSEIMALAEKRVAHKDFDAAADYYNEVERLYPYSVEAKYALIGAAKAYHEARMYPESRAAASRYLDFYPTTSDAPLAMYLVALSYYDQIIDIHRDQSNTYKALQVFNELILTYPGTEYAGLAQEKFGIALNQLAGKELDIGRYYLRRGHYAAAIERFRAVIDQYGETSQTPEAMYRLIEAYLSLGLVGEAKAALAQLGTAYPDSDWYRDGSTLMAGR